LTRQSLYRRYRPATFAAVVGQNHIERTLRNAVATDSVAHAYLFTGPRGTGKTTTARILAAALVCSHTSDGEPDGTCEQCQLVNEGRHPDVVELDAASQTGVDNVREEIINNMHLATVHGKSKVYIIDEVHMLSKGAFNALLKTLEEPPPQVRFILCTTDPQKVLPTVRSRCQEFDFHPIGLEDIASRLDYIAQQENIQVQSAALELIARHANGGMRDAITLFEKMAAYSNNDITVADVEESMGGVSSDSLADLMRIVAARDTSACFSWVARQVEAGTDLVEATRALLDYVRDAYVICMLGAIDADGIAVGVNRTGNDLANLREIAALFAGPTQIARLLDLLCDLSDKLRYSTEPRILLELTLARAMNAQGDQSTEALMQRIEALEAGITGTGKQANQVRPAAPAEISEPAATKRLDTDTSAPASESQQSASAKSTPPTHAADNTAAAVPETQSTAVQLSDDPATLTRKWSEILEQIRAIKPSRHPLFSNARLRADADAQTLIIEFAQTDSAKHKQVARPDNRELLEKAILAVYGAQIPFVAQMGQFAGAAPQPPVANMSNPASTQEAPPYEEAPLVPDFDTEPEGAAFVPGHNQQQTSVASADIPTPELELVSKDESDQQTYRPPTREVATILDDLGATVVRQTTD